MSDNTNSQDWLAIVSLNKDIDVKDPEKYGLSVNDLDLKPQEEYKNNEKVKKYFTDPVTNKFNEEAFNNIYNYALKSFNDIQFRKIAGDFENELVLNESDIALKEGTKS